MYHILEDRQIHKAECKNILIPPHGLGMIYDNGVSQIGKGLHWHFRRFEDQLHWHYRSYGREGVTLILDLDPQIKGVVDCIAAHSPCPMPGIGMPLDAEESQQEMVALPSIVDNWVKSQAGVHCMGHYIEGYMQGQCAYYKNYEDHGRILRLHRLN